MKKGIRSILLLTFGAIYFLTLISSHLLVYADQGTDCPRGPDKCIDTEDLNSMTDNATWADPRLQSDSTTACNSSASVGASFSEFQPDPQAITIYTNQIKERVKQLAPLYQQAAQADNIADWELFAAIHDAETGGSLSRRNPSTNTYYKSPFQMSTSGIQAAGGNPNDPMYAPGHIMTDAEFVTAATIAGKQYIADTAKSINADLSKPLAVEQLAKIIAGYNLGSANIFTQDSSADLHVLKGDAYVWAGWSNTPLQKLPMYWKPSNFGQADPYHVPGGLTVIGLIRASGSLTPSGDSTGCTSTDNGAVANNIAQTALNFAWDDYNKPGGHTSTSKGESQAKPAFVSAAKKYDASALGTLESESWADCGIFVATVVRASGVDPNYWPSYTVSQLEYVSGTLPGQSQKSINFVKKKYKVYAPGEWGVGSTSSVKPQVGDIFISQEHTYIYIGKQPSGYSVAEASQNEHIPIVDAVPYTDQFNGTDKFNLVRILN